MVTVYCGIVNFADWNIKNAVAPFMHYQLHSYAAAKITGNTHHDYGNERSERS